MMDKEELLQYIKTFENVEEIEEIIILGVDGSIRRIIFEEEVGK